jgi:hypothetical protein
MRSAKAMVGWRSGRKVEPPFMAYRRVNYISYWQKMGMASKNEK